MTTNGGTNETNVGANKGTPQPVQVPAPLAEAVPQPVAAALPANTDEIKVFVLALVSEKTGYPAEVLDLNWTSRPIFGIDTVKQAELLLRSGGQYGIARRETCGSRTSIRSPR